MQIKRWNFEFETRPSLIGIFVYAIFGILGLFFFNDRMVFLPVAFLAGIVTGLLSSSHKRIGNNGIVVTLVGFLLIMIFSTSQHVSSLADSTELTLADQLFSGVVFFLAEGIYLFIIILPLGYVGALLIEIIRKKRQPGTEPRDLSDLNP